MPQHDRSISNDDEVSVRVAEEGGTPFSALCPPWLNPRSRNEINVTSPSQTNDRAYHMEP